MNSDEIKSLNLVMEPLTTRMTDIYTRLQIKQNQLTMFASEKNCFLLY